MNNKKLSNLKFRIFHRYLGNFLAGIMAVYALSGFVLIFRDTDFLKQEYQIEKTVASNISPQDLAKALQVKGLKVEKQQGDVLYFDKGQYNKKTGVANYTVLKLPIVLDKLTHLHKAKTSDPLYWLNIFFAACLLMLVISSFWMFRPSTKTFTNGLYFTAAGIGLVLIIIFI
jgi:hypothetical protein